LDTPEPDPLQEKINAIHTLLVKAQASDMKVNEAQTEMWIINPLLDALGYSPLEIHKQSHDAHTKQFPDYTLLPHEACRWFLEVKSLDVTLGGTEAAQAVGYAVNKGAEWAVLTNGRKWQFYKAHLPKPLPEKLVFEIKDLFAELSAADTLRLLSRASVLADGLTQAWLADQIGPIVEKELANAQSATRKALRKVAAAETQTAVTDAAIADVLKRLIGVGALPVKAGDLPPLSYWAQNVNLVVGQRPAYLKLGEAEAVQVKSWSVLAQSVVKFVGEKYGLPPLPFTGTRTGTKFFVNDANAQVTGKPMTTMANITVSGKTIYLEMNRSADDTILRLTALLQAVGAPLDAVKIKIITQK
jgi:hypothetical protein